MDIHRTLKTLYRPIDEVMKYPPGPKRWRAAHDLLWLRMSYKNRQIYNDMIEECRLFREANATVGNKYSKTKDKNSGMRQYLSFPTGAFHAISRADPQAFMKKSNDKKMFNEFKEYRKSEVF